MPSFLAIASGVRPMSRYVIASRSCDSVQSGRVRRAECGTTSGAGLRPPPAVAGPGGVGAGPTAPGCFL
jgi:hypothetical protein